MNAKLFGLFSVTSLAGAVLLAAPGCSDNVTQAFDDVDAGSSGGSSSGGKKSSSTSSSSSSSSSGGSDTSSSSGGSSSGGSSSGGKSSTSSSGGGGTSGSTTSSSGVTSSSSSSSGSIVVDAGQDAAPPPGSCMVTTPIDATKYPYVKAVKSAGACTTTEAQALSDYITNLPANQDIVLADWKAKVSTKCATCVFTDTTATSWGPLLTQGADLADLNQGGCIEIKSGKQACGQAYQQAVECRLDACYTNCTTQQELDDCLADGAAIFGGPCKNAYNNVTTQCGANLGTYETACQGTKYVFDGDVKVQCVTGN